MNTRERCQRQRCGFAGVFEQRRTSTKNSALTSRASVKEEETFRYGVDPVVFRKELETVIEASFSSVLAVAHWADRTQGDDFVRCGRHGGLAHPGPLYGRAWFVLLAGRRWKKIAAEQLAEVFAVLSEERS